MINHLTGKVIQREILTGSPGGCLTLDVVGVGYEVFVPLSTYYELPDKDLEVSLHIHTHFKQEILQLYGFLSSAERSAFRCLISVSNIGPRTALGILSGLLVSDLVQVVENGDIPTLTKLPGIGDKTAERIIFELHAKKAFKELASQTYEITELPVQRAFQEDLLSALMNLGYSRKEALRAAQQSFQDLSSKFDKESLALEDLVKASLSYLGKSVK